MGRGTAEFLVSEANKDRSRDVVTVAAGAAPGLVPGTILGKLTAGGNYVRWNPAGADGSQNVAGVLYEAAVGTGLKTVIGRDAEVNAAHLTYNAGATAGNKTTANDGLKTLGIIVR